MVRYHRNNNPKSKMFRRAKTLSQHLAFSTLKQNVPSLSSVKKFAYGKRVLTKFEKDERLRKILPLPWIAIATYCVATWMKSSYSLINDDFEKDIQECLQSQENKKKQADSLMKLIEMTEGAGDPFTVSNLPKLFGNGIIKVIKQGLKSSDLLVLESTVFLASQVAKEASASHAMSLDEDLSSELAQVLNFALPLDLSLVDELISREGSTDKSTYSVSKKPLMEEGVSVELMLLWPILNTLAALSKTLKQDWSFSALGIPVPFVTASLADDGTIAQLKGIDADLIVKISTLLRMQTSSISGDNSQSTSQSGGDDDGDTSESSDSVDIAKEKVAVALTEIHQSTLELLNNVSKNQEMVHLLVDKAVISALTNIAQHEENPYPHRLLATQTIENVLRFYKNRMDAHRALGNLDSTSEKLGRVGKTGLTFSQDDEQWCRHRWHHHVPKNLKQMPKAPSWLILKGNMGDNSLSNMGILWGAFRGLLDYYSQAYLAESMKQSFFMSVGYNALKTSLGADVLAKTWNIMPLVSAKIQRHPSFGVWGMKSLHQKNPESQDQDKTAIENSALSLAMFLGQNSRLSEQSL